MFTLTAARGAAARQGRRPGGRREGGRALPLHAHRRRQEGRVSDSDNLQCYSLQQVPGADYGLSFVDTFVKCFAV